MAGAPVPEKRKRQVHPKTRTGCKTCKIRKVKCDEAKPFCKRCTSTGRKCDGYPSSQPIQAIFLAPKTTTGYELARQINTSIPGSAAEKRGFNFFVTKTAKELSGYFKEEFWNGFVLRGCHAHGALRHAVVGIGALHEQYEQESDGKVGGDNKFAVDQYAKAITHLRQTLHTATEDDSPLTALISCVLFVSFDSLRGNFESAMLHLQSGLKILKEVRSQMRSKTKRNGWQYTQEEVFIIRDYIAPLFVRLIVQAILYVDTRTNAEKMILARELSVEDSDYDTQQAGLCDDNEPEKLIFQNLEEAREKINNCAGGLFRMFYVCDSAKSMSQQPAMAHNLLYIHSQALFAWSTAFNTYMSAHMPTLSTTQIRGATLLKIHHTTLEIMRLSAPTMTDPRPIAEVYNSASTFRGTVDLFASIVRLSKSLIAAIEQDVLKTGQPMGSGKTFSPDLGVVGPLYYVGTKCTVAEIRDEALALLKRWKGREGMWDSCVGSKLVSEFWKMESRIGTRGYNINGPEVESPFDHAMRTGRVRLNLVQGKKWQWKYKRDGNVDDGIFEDLPDEEAPSSPTTNLEAEDLSNPAWDWSIPEPLSEVDLNLGMYESPCYMGVGGLGTDCDENHNYPPPPMVEEWMDDPGLWTVNHNFGTPHIGSVNDPNTNWVAGPQSEECHDGRSGEFWTGKPRGYEVLS